MFLPTWLTKDLHYPTRRYPSHGTLHGCPYHSTTWAHRVRVKNANMMQNLVTPKFQAPYSVTYEATIICPESRWMMVFPHWRNSVSRHNHFSLANQMKLSMNSKVLFRKKKKGKVVLLHSNNVFLSVFSWIFQMKKSFYILQLVFRLACGNSSGVKAEPEIGLESYRNLWCSARWQSKQNHTSPSGSMHL